MPSNHFDFEKNRYTVEGGLTPTTSTRSVVGVSLSLCPPPCLGNPGSAPVNHARKLKLSSNVHLTLLLC